MKTVNVPARSGRAGFAGRCRGNSDT